MSHRALSRQQGFPDPTPAEDTHGVPVGHVASDIREHNGRLVHDPVSAAWESVGVRGEPEEEHPERYAPNKGFSTHLIPGQRERRYNTSPEGVATEYDVHPVPWRERDQHERPRGSSGMPFDHEGEPYTLAKVPGSERPLKHIYRIVHEREFQEAGKRGYLQSHGGMNLGADEGTCASDRSTGSFYAAAGPNRILRIDHHPEDGWKRDNDNYIKTQQPVPFSRISKVSPILHNEETDTRSQPGGGVRKRKWTLPQGFT